MLHNPAHHNVSPFGAPTQRPFLFPPAVHLGRLFFVSVHRQNKARRLDAQHLCQLVKRRCRTVAATLYISECRPLADSCRHCKLTSRQAAIAKCQLHRFYVDSHGEFPLSSVNLWCSIAPSLTIVSWKCAEKLAKFGRCSTSPAARKA